jgi:hypothetical protein
MQIAGNDKDSCIFAYTALPGIAAGDFILDRNVIGLHRRVLSDNPDRDSERGTSFQP